MIIKILKKLLVLIVLIPIGIFTYRQAVNFQKSDLEDTASKIAYPIITVSKKVYTSIKDYFSQKDTLEILQEKLKKLQEEYENLLMENVKLKGLINYDSLTKELLEFQKRYDLKNAILARILTKNYSDNEQYFIINRGSNENVKENMVAVYKFQIIGRVSEVYEKYSKVLLISDHNCKVSAITKTTQAKGISQGKNLKNQCELAYVSQNYTLTTDDLVLSNGQGLVFPEGFCIGKVTNFQTKDLCFAASVEPLINFDSMDYCLLINRESGINF